MERSEDQTMLATANNDTYMSLYEYLGKGSRTSGVGKLVSAEAIKRGIKVQTRLLPKEMQRPEFNTVQAYPLSFLDEYFANNVEYDMTPFVRRSALIMLQSRIDALEKNYAELIKLLPTPTIELTTNAYQDDDLPF
jgi:hypothetical protein